MTAYILWPVLFCALMCAAMSINYALTDNRRAQELAIRWLKRLLVFTAISLTLIYLGGAK